MYNRPYSKTTPLTDLLKPKTKYGENSPAHIIQKARMEVSNDQKASLHSISKPKIIKSTSRAVTSLIIVIRRQPNARYLHKNRKRRPQCHQISE